MPLRVSCASLAHSQLVATHYTISIALRRKDLAMAAMFPIRDTDVLVVVDVQNDFCPGGALAVPKGDEVVPIVNRMAARFRNVVLTQDWHPRSHSSFASSHPGKQPFETITAY